MKRAARTPTLSQKERLILELLVGHGPLYGLQIVTLSEGRVKRGTVYVTLGRMEEKGYLESEPDPAASDTLVLPRRIYRPTGFGLRVLAAWQILGRSLGWEPSR